MITSRESDALSHIEGTDPIPAGLMAYLCARTQSAYFDFVHEKLKEAEANGLTRATLAQRIGKSKTRLSHMLAAPSNWTLDTVTQLLIGICREIPNPDSTSLLEQPTRNITADDALKSVTDNPQVEITKTGGRVRVYKSSESDSSALSSDT